MSFVRSLNESISVVGFVSNNEPNMQLNMTEVKIAPKNHPLNKIRYDFFADLSKIIELPCRSGIDNIENNREVIERWFLSAILYMIFEVNVTTNNEKNIETHVAYERALKNAIPSSFTSRVKLIIDNL